MSKVLEDVVLMSLRSPFLDDSKIYSPMANLYLKSFLAREFPEINITLGDDNYSLDNLGQFERFDAIGLSVMTPQREEMNKLARALKSQYPNKTLIVGGPHVKHYKEEVIANKDFDFVVPYDGERPLRDICLGLANGRVLEDVMSREDIKSAPRPDRTSQNAREVIGRYHYKLKDSLGNERDATTMMTSRGCPMGCTFCEDAKTVAKWSSLDNLKLEMDDIRNLGYRGVYLFDDLFAIAMPTVKPITEELKKRDLIYRCNGQANFFTKWGEDFAKLLADTGCVEIAFGHESGSQKILDNVDKRTTVKQNYDSVKFAHKYGIRVKSFLMLGLPGEDRQTIQDTELFIKNAGIDDFQLAVFYPYKGTQIRDAMDRGELGLEIHFEGEGLGAYGQKGGSTESVVRTDFLSSKQLLSERDRIVKIYKPKSHAKMNGDKFFDTRFDEKDKSVRELLDERMGSST